MSNLLTVLRSDPSSEYYNAYSQPTSTAVKNLTALGFNTSLLNDDFFGSKEYQSFMAANLEHSDTTGGVKSPSKKSTIQNQIAYNLNNAYKDYQETKKAKEEYNAAMNEAIYLAGNPGWNYSDEKILEKINEDFDTKYPTLAKMKNSNATPVALTEAVDFSDDALLGAMWAARNPEYQGGLEGAMANSYLGKGNVWKEDPKISAMLNPEDPNFLPYATGSTNLLKEGQLLGRYYYPEEYFDSDEFKNKYFNGTEEEKAACEHLLKAESDQKAADKAVPAIMGYANSILANDHDASSVRNKLDTVLATGKLYVSTDKNGNKKYYTKPGKGREEIDLSILNKIDKTVGKTDVNGERSLPVNDPEELLSFTRGVNYKYDNLIGQVNDICDQYSKQSSSDTYANLNPDNQGTTREKKPFELIEETKSKRAADAMYILDDKLSEMERKNFGALPMPNGTKLADAFYNVKRGLWANGEEIVGPYDTQKLTNPEWVAKMATRQAEKAEKNYEGVALNSLQVRTEYEANQKEADQLQAQLDEINNRYGDIELAKNDMPEIIPLELDKESGYVAEFKRDENGVYHYVPDPDFSVYANYKGISEEQLQAELDKDAQRMTDSYSITSKAKNRVFKSPPPLVLEDDEGNSLSIPFVYDEKNGEFTLSPEFNSRDKSVWDFLNNSGLTENEMWVDINEHINDLNKELEGPDETEKNRISARLDQLRGQLSATQGDYDKAVKDLNKANDRRTRVNEITLRNSGMYVDPAITDNILSYVSKFTDFIKPKAGYDSLVDDLEGVFGLRELTREEAKDYKNNVLELDEYAKDIHFMLDNYNLPDFYKKKLTEAAEYYESRSRLYNAYLITKEDDYESLIKEALDENNELSYDGIAKPYRSGINKTAWGQMTSTERGVYYALSVKEGLEAATQFYQDIEENLITRARTNIREGVKETAESGILGRVFNELASVGSAVLEVPLNIAYLIDSAINGEGSKWWRIPSEAAQEAHQAVINELNTIYDGTIWKDIFTGGAEMFNNRFRSYAVGGVFGKFMPQIPGEGKLVDAANDIISSFPIATIAFGEAYEDAMENDMEPWQAWTLGTVNFLCESVTEGIKFGNYESLLEGNLTLDTFKDYFLDKIAGLDWLEEATGETLNNILERAFNKWIGGDKSEEQKKIQEYIDSGLVSSVDEARARVMADYVKEDMHTAIISALSSFVDVGMFGVGKLMDTAHYAKEVAKARMNGDTTTTIRGLRNNDIQMVKTIQDFQKQAEQIRQQRIEEANKPFVPQNPANVSAEHQARNQEEYDVDQTILENSADSDQGTVTETIAAVLRISDQNANRANAAAVAFADRFGEDSIGTLQAMLEAGRKSGTNINTLKLGIQYSLLADGECRQVMSSEAYQNATPEQQAQMLSAATQVDANNQNVQAEVQQAVHENRVAEAEKDLFGENEAFELNALEENADEAAKNTYIAQEEYNDRVEARKAAADNVTTVTMDFLADPSDENKKRKDQAERELAAADSVAKEYEQALQKARDKQTKAENALETTKDDIMTRIREEAENRVAKEEASEADAARKADEALKAAEEERVRIQAEEDERTGKAQEDEDLAKIDEYIQKQGLTGERAEQLRQKAVQFYQDAKAGNVDTSKLLSDAEADLAIFNMGRRLGIAIEVDKEGDPNALQEGRDGKYSNGKITLSHRLTVGQAMLQVAMHEITHSLEKTKSYGKYKDTVFSILFNSPEQRETAIQNKLDFYRTRGVKNFTREDAESEIVADFAMDDKTFANRETINRMLDEGLGGKIRNALHNINQYLKNAKLDGEERVKAENLRKAERQYIKAMNERRNINTHPSSEQFSVNQFAAAAGLFYNEVNVTDDMGNVIAGPGLYTADPSNPENNAVKVDKVTPEMMENTPVGLLTNAAQALGTMDKETAGKVHAMFADLMTMCTNLQDTNLVWEIAGSTLYSEFSAIKANSDKQYSNTVDFGTICTKTQAVINQLSRDMLRLGRGLTSQEILEVYNDVYNADLKVPCPVCYVFSRWLGVPSLLENIRQYQNRFLGEEGAEVDAAETQKRVNEFIAKAHQEYGIDKNFDDNLKKAREKALAKVEKIKNGKDGIAETEAKIARLKDQLKTRQRKDWQNQLAAAEKKLTLLQDDLKQAQADYDNSEINAYAKAINKKKADIESSIKDKLIKIEGDDRGKRGINDDIRDALKEGKPIDKLEAQRAKVYAEIDKLNEQLREVDAYNWVTQALCTMDRDGNFVIDPEFKRTKNEILLDLNRTGEFAKDTKNWTYRSTRGAGMGKAILPYSGASIGDSVLGVGSRTMANPYEDGDSEGAFSALKSAIAKAKRQNLIGGQRFQSTSDFRPEWGLDYIMTFIEQQAIGSNGQLYTKVKEFAPLAASVGIDTNCSIMPYANGWHDPADGEIESMPEEERKSRVVTFKDDNGNERTVVLDFSDVTGMEYDAARELSKNFDSVQMIMVGINDIHIRACLAGEEIDFVIPWHASGNTKSQLQSMMATVNETLTNSSDYTKVQTDQIADKEGLKEAHGKLERGETLTAHEADLIHKEQMRDARVRLLTGATLTATDMERIAESSFLTSLYERFEGKTLDGKELPHDSAYWIEFEGSEPERVTMTTGQAEQIFPYEYWDTSLTKDQADENGWRFVQYCQELGLTPRFSGGNQKNDDNSISRFGNFSGAVYDADGNIIGYDRNQMAKGYWKTLIDRKMYDNNGNYRAQQQIDASKVQTGSLVQGENGRVHVGGNIPDSISGANYRGEEAEAKYKKADQALKDRLTEKAKLEGKEGDQARIDLANLNTWETAHANDHEQYRVTPEINPYEEMTTGEMMQLLTDAGVDYMEGFGELNPEAISSDYTDSDGDPVTNEAVEVSDVKTQYSIRRFAPPEKTITCYKAFYARDGKLYPPMVSNNTNAEDIQKGTKLTSGTMRGLETPVGVWLDADVGGLAVDENGEPLRTATTNRLRVKNDKGGDSLAFRPGWHLGEWPDATQFYKTDPVTGEKKSVMPDDLVFAECEIAADKDYQMEAFELGMTENGKFNRSQAGLPRVPVDGYYKYRTNANPKEAPWYISGAMKVNRILTDEECREICAKHGVTPGERYSHHDINLEDYGLKAGPVVQTENLERFEKNQASYDNDALLERALNDERYRGAYVRRTLNFDDERLRNEFRIDRISDEQYENYRNEYTAPKEQWSINDNNNPEMTSAEMLQLLRDAGVYQQEEAPTDYEATGPQRQFGSETVQNAEGVSQTVKNWLKQHSDYNPDTNNAQIDRAVKWVMGNRSNLDPEGFWTSLEKVENKDFNPLTADGQAKMYVLMSMASNKNDINVQLRLADAINKQGTTIGQALQARRMFRLMTPEGRLSVLQKEVDRVNSELKSKGKEGNVTLSDWILRSAAAAQTEEEFAKAREAMWKELGSQLPVSWWDRFQAWRMVSMLGNVRTHGRNLVGNLGFVPVVGTKNKIGAALESIFVPEGERTKAFRTDKAALEFADMDADRMQSKLTGEGKYTDATQIQRNKKPFGNSKIGKIIQGYADFSGDMLEKEDWIFLRHHYKKALAGWMTANKVTGEQLEADTEKLDKARAYAIEEAQKATYRDANALAEWLSKGDRIPGVRLLTTSILPFKKTPMNILKRGLEYSPLGFMKNITADVVRLAEYQKWANGKKAEKADWALSPSQFIDKISSGITGIGIAGIGAFMKSMGWLTLGFKKDDPEDEFKKAKGEQEYSLHIKLFGQDITYTIDWAAPACMPLFVGATMQEAAESGNADLGETLTGMASVTEPIWNLSMLDGLNSLFETSQYEDGNVATQILMKVGLNYANSFIPTAVGQFSRIIDPTRRKSFVQSGSKPSAAYYALEQMENKTPFSVYNIPYRDVRGNEDRRSIIQRVIENIFSPGYYNSTANDDTLNELERLYKDNAGNESIKPSELKKLVPENADKSFTVKNETIRLTDKQYDQMDVERKQYAFDLMDRLMADPYYAKVDDVARIDMINDIWTYATQQAKYNQFPQVTREDWITRAQKNNIDMLDVIKKRSEDQIKQDSIDGWGEALVDSIKAGYQDDIDTAYQTLELHDLDEDDINKIVKNGFSKDYVKAYKDNDEDAMSAIEAMITDAGFEFDYEDWLQATINNEEKWLEDYNK